MENALDAMMDYSYFGTMMVHKDMADGMVSGAAHTTANTIRPAFQFIRTPPEVVVVSSVFLMCFETRVLVYGDCAVNPNPTPEQLAEIAISSAKTAQMFGIEPIVAMLSYSTGMASKGERTPIYFTIVSMGQDHIMRTRPFYLDLPADDDYYTIKDRGCSKNYCP